MDLDVDALLGALLLAEHVPLPIAEEAPTARRRMGAGACRRAGREVSVVRIAISCSRRELGSNLAGRRLPFHYVSLLWARGWEWDGRLRARGWRIGGDDDARLGRRRRAVGDRPAMALGW